MGIKRATLYTYVSRGWIRSDPSERGRARRYWAQDVDHVAARAESSTRRRARRHITEPDPLRWADTGVDTEVSGEVDGRLLYRGRDAIHLADAGVPFADVAEWLWQAEPAPSPWAVGPAIPTTLPGNPLWRMAAALPLVAGADPPGAREVAERGRRLLLVLAECLAPPGAAERLRAARDAGDPARAAAAALSVPEHAATLDRALVLLADGPVDDVTTAVRVVAATGADPYACLGAGLAVLGGPQHAGACAGAEAMLDEVAARGADAAVQARLFRGDRIPGFGASSAVGPALLTGVGGSVAALVAAAERAGLGAPSVAMGLVGLTRALSLDSGSAAGLWALGRAAGLLAHVLEQQAQRAPRWPRTRYVGPIPSSS